MPLALGHDSATIKMALLEELRTHALIHQRVTLSNGSESDYYVDAKRALLQPAAFNAVGALVLDVANELGAKAVGGMSIGADPVAFAALATDPQNELVAFLVRKQRKAHGMQRWIEGPTFPQGTPCLVVDDVVTTGRSTIDAIERVRDTGLHVAGALAVLDRLAGGGDAIAEAADAPFQALVTIDEIYPDRPDRV